MNTFDKLTRAQFRTAKPTFFSIGEIDERLVFSSDRPIVVLVQQEREELRRNLRTNRPFVQQRPGEFRFSDDLDSMFALLSREESSSAVLRISFVGTSIVLLR